MKWNYNTSCLHRDLSSVVLTLLEGPTATFMNVCPLKTIYCSQVLEWQSQITPVYTTAYAPFLTLESSTISQLQWIQTEIHCLNNPGSWIETGSVLYLRGFAESQNRKAFCFCFVFHLLFIFLGKRNYITPIAKPSRIRQEHLVSIWLYNSNTKISSLNMLTIMHAPQLHSTHTHQITSPVNKKTTHP